MSEQPWPTRVIEEVKNKQDPNRIIGIEISGHVNTGKTSAAVIIEKALTDAGFNVCLTPNQDGDQESKRQLIEEGRLDSKVFSDTKIYIREVQLRRVFEV